MGYDVTKPFRYAGKQLEAGDSFEPVRARDVKIFKAMGKIADVSEEIAALRERAVSLGVEVDGRWGPDRLNEEIAKVTAPPPPPAPDKKPAGYNRRDMRAQK